MPVAPREPSPLTAVIAVFDAAYREAYGAGATWGAKQSAQLKRLIVAHGADEVTRRIGVLFSGMLDWPRPPYDLNALVSHFDRLVGVSSRARPSEILRGKS